MLTTAASSANSGRTWPVRARAESPLLVRLVGQQLAAVGRVLAGLEALDVGGHLGGRGELDHPAAKHDDGAIAERA